MFEALKIEDIKIEAISACVPKNEIDNYQFGKTLFNEKELEITIGTTGAFKKRICKNNKTTALELCLKAAEEIFKLKPGLKEKIAGVVFVTQSPSQIVPNNSSYIQHLLGLSKEVFAIDVNHACSGYAYGLYISSLMVNNTNKSILLLDGDKQSHFVSPFDKSTALLFSDAGSATVLSKSENTKCFFNFVTDGSKRDILQLKDGGSLHWFKEDSLIYREYPDGSKRKDLDVYMDGLEVFKYVFINLPKSINKLFIESKINKDEIDFFVFHQANKYMIDMAQKNLKIETSKVLISINKYGNSSSSTIPVTICSELNEQISNNKCRMLLSGYGAGMSFANCILDIGPCLCTGVIEYEE